MATDSLNASDLKLLSYKPDAPGRPPQATVFASEAGLIKLRKKFEDFAEKNRVRDGVVGRPYNADLAQSIQVIVEAGLRSLWRSPPDQFPVGDGIAFWEVWLDKEQADAFIARAAEFNVAISTDRLFFPEDTVVIASATPTNLALAIRKQAGIRALAIPSTTSDFFDGLEPEEQVDWVQELLDRTTYTADPNSHHVTLLDTGVSRAHPLIQPALAAADRHAAKPEWSVEDNKGHGTEMAGLALFGDLYTVLSSTTPINIRHRIESSKIMPDVGANPHHLLGTITRQGVNAAEAGHERQRTFVLANSTNEDTPHDGAPTSWSTEIDQLTSGVSGNRKIDRLFMLSAGNSDQTAFGNHDYLGVSDGPDNEIYSPAHAWNAISVGGYTEKTVLPQGTPGVALAPSGDLSPCSRTASWASHWPLKPDVVLEGGNWLVDGAPPPLRHAALGTLTTHRSFPARAFVSSGDTSGAVALAAGAITDLWTDYSELWPETIRALFVSSARWTPAMKAHLPANPLKGDYATLFRRYGYGVPDLERARRSAANGITMMIEDTITPYKKSQTAGADHVHNEMKIFNLPWPTDALRNLGAYPVTLRVALGTFIRPNPAEETRGTKFGYASHNLRFRLKRAGETDRQFLSRVNMAAEAEALEPNEDDGWAFGRNRRDVGSLHIDQLTCPASDLARRDKLVVFPVTGWWKSKRSLDPENRTARYSLIVEIDAGTANVDLYTEVATAIMVQAAAAVEV